MDSASPTGCCNCGCPRCCSPSSPKFRRSVKRKADLSGRDAQVPPAFARVDVENELTALRETLASQQGAIQELSVELEEERNAAETAASETMSMILRLQHEKAEIQMEARQFRRFAEEKMAHDCREIADLEDLLFKRDQEAQALSCEARAYKHRLLSLGIEDERYPISFNSCAEDEFDVPRAAGYPSLRCNSANYSCDDEADDIERRIYELEKTPVNVRSKVPDSPPGHLRHFSTEGSSLMPSEIVNGNGDEEDDATDRIYTIDAVHGVPVGKCCVEEELDSSKLREGSGAEMEEGDIKKLYMRLQALEADRESMRQAIISMRTEKAQLVLLREIAQQLRKEVKPERRIVKKKASLFGEFSFVSLIKWFVPFLFWRKKASRSRYTFGLSNGNVGLLQVLDKSPWIAHCKLITRTTLRGR